MARIVSQKTTATENLDTSIASAVSFVKDNPVVIGFDASSAKVVGLTKASLMFYRIMFTQKGSDPMNKSFGTRLVELFEGSVTDRDALYGFVKMEVDAALEQVQYYQNRAEVSQEEQIISADITAFAFDENTLALNFSVDLRSATGETNPLQIPSIVLA